MGILDKLPFGKKKDDLGFNQNETGMNFNDPNAMGGQFGGGGYGMPPPQMDSLNNQQGFNQNRDMELISAKLDAIKAMLENLNQRVANLERIAQGEQEEQQKRKW